MLPPEPLNAFFRHTMRMPTRPTRLPGLDTLRASAIALVFVYHYMVTVSHRPTFGAASSIGWTGVDLFFVLSGYLIGNQLFSELVTTATLSLPRFYARRLLRTLPNFYVILALYLLFPAMMGGTAPPATWRFLSFTQNIGLHTGTAFSHAWSLCIEEQFYLLLPAATLLLTATRSVRAGWTILGAFMLGGILTRSLLWQRYGGNGETYYNNIYYASWCRIDELLPGVALAMIRNFHPLTWQRLLRHGNRILCAGVLATALTMFLLLNFHERPDDSYGYWMTAFGYPMLACSFALLTLAALCPSSLLQRVRLPGATTLAHWSYAIYLTHKPLMNMMKIPLRQQGIGVESLLGISLMIGASVAGGWLLYAAVETPFMRWRERWFAAPTDDTENKPTRQSLQISEGIPTP